MTSPILPACYSCKHFLKRESVITMHCKAFKNEEIPKEIRVSKNDHRKPFAGDNGIQFEPIND